MAPLILRCKVALLGNATVGKTALSSVFEKNAYPKNYSMTSGAELRVKNVSVSGTDTIVELYLIDLAGNEAYGEMLTSYLDNVSALALLYDTTNRQSFETLEQWLEFYKRLHPEKNLIGAVVATKVDLEGRREVDPTEAEGWARQHGLEFFETSALDGRNVDGPFSYIAQAFQQKYEDFVGAYDG